MNFEYSCDQVPLGKNDQNSGRSFSHPIIFPNVGSKRKKKKENTDYNGIFIPLKSQVYSKQSNPTFLLFGSWSLVLYLQVSANQIFFW